MTDQHLSRGIVLVFVLVLLMTAGSCVVAQRSAPDVTPPAANIPRPAVAAPQPSDDLLFSSGGERLFQLRDQYEKEVRCTKGNGSKGAPIICVDNLSMRPDPYWVQVWDFEGVGGQKSEQPVFVHWFTRRTAILNLEFQPGPDGKACVTNLVCDKTGHCSARVEPLGDRPDRSCRYNVWIDGRQVESKSPLFSVVPCCW